jgi:hypothetical protein
MFAVRDQDLFDRFGSAKSYGLIVRETNASSVEVFLF